MRTSGFKKPTYQQALQKKIESQKKRASRAKKRPSKKRKARKATVKRLSPILGINEKAKQASYHGFSGTRYRGVKGVAWTLFSRYVRQRDNYICATCGNTTPEAQQAGHYWPVGLVGSNNRLSWDEMNVHSQCKKCNEKHGGLQKLMADYIDREYGEDVRKSLDERVHKTDPVENWEAMVIFYEGKLNSL